MSWLDGGKAAKIAWPSPPSSAAAAAAHKVTYSREPGVVNQVTVGGASQEATLRGLVPGSTYAVEVLRLGLEDGAGAAVVVARGSLATPEVLCSLSLCVCVCVIFLFLFYLFLKINVLVAVG